MSIIDHILLFGFLFLSFYIICRLPQKYINENYWKVTSLIIFIYSIILGCRYGWGNDYLWYKERFEEPHIEENENIGFRILNIFLNNIGFNYVGAFIIYSLLYITCAFTLIKGYKHNKYMISFFLPATLLQSTFTIRQSVAHSLIFLSILGFAKEKWHEFWIYLLIAYFIHPAAILLFLPVLLFSLFKEKIIPLYISIPIYIFVSISTNIISSFVSDWLSEYLPLISLGNKFDHYLQDDKWYGENAINSIYQQSVSTLILSMLFQISIIYLCNITLKYKPNKNIATLYNTIVIGFILTRIFFLFEIFRRISEPLIILYFIPLGYAFDFIINNQEHLGQKEKILSNTSIIIILIYLLLYFGRFLFMSPEYMFFWNQ